MFSLAILLSATVCASALFVDEKSELNIAVSAAIASMNADGTLDRIYADNFGTPVRS
jgi:hypothetical protein